MELKTEELELLQRLLYNNMEQNGLLPREEDFRADLYEKLEEMKDDDEAEQTEDTEDEAEDYSELLSGLNPEQYTNWDCIEPESYIDVPTVLKCDICDEQKNLLVLFEDARNLSNHLKGHDKKGVGVSDEYGTVLKEDGVIQDHSHDADDTEQEAERTCIICDKTMGKDEAEDHVVDEHDAAGAPTDYLAKGDTVDFTLERWQQIPHETRVEIMYKKLQHDPDNTIASYASMLFDADTYYGGSTKEYREIRNRFADIEKKYDETVRSEGPQPKTWALA